MYSSTNVRPAGLTFHSHCWWSFEGRQRQIIIEGEVGEALVPKKSVSVQPCITTGQQTIPSQAEEDEKEYIGDENDTKDESSDMKHSEHKKPKKQAHSDAAPDWVKRFAMAKSIETGREVKSNVLDEDMTASFQ